MVHPQSVESMAMGYVVWLWTAVVIAVIPSGHAASLNLPGRLCVPQNVDCSLLSRLSGGVLTCINVRDRVDCLKKMRDHQADFGYFEAEDLNMAADSFGDKFETLLQIVTGKEVRSVYLLVHNSTNLNIKSVCHPGVNLQRYYPRALYRPVTSTSDEFVTDKSQVDALSTSWSKACIPGSWSQDPITDRQLKQDKPHLCEACVRKNCDAKDPYAGSGAIQCLLDHAADAAFVSDVDFRKARLQNPEVEKLSHFCYTGNATWHTKTILPLGDRASGDGEPCDRGKRPLPVLLSPSCEDIQCISRRNIWVKALSTQAKTVIEVLGLPQGTQFKTVREKISPSRAIKMAGYKLNLTQPKNPVRFCVHNEAEREKCEDLKMAARAYGVDAGVGVDCFLDPTEHHCYPDIYFGNADVISLDGGDVHQVTQDFGFERVLSEVYDTGAVSPTSSYYAVAVVRADSNITAFSQLQGRKSCHTGIGKTAGWKLPLATLLHLGLIDPLHCNYVSAAAEFFSGGSCAPGAKHPSYNKQNNYVDRLCSLCIGAGENQCARTSDEPFYSYSGAFRCLVQGGGDVAFVKHSTVPDNTDGSSSADWTIGLQSDRYKLLCPSGGTAAISEFRTCNLALVPAHEVVMSGRSSPERFSQVRQVLLGISEVFKGSSPGSKTFQLYGSYHGKSDLLFKDSAVGLKALSDDTPEERERKNDYFKKLGELHSCEIRVCALEEQMADCEAMADTVSELGQQFVCVSARDRFDCVRRMMRGQIDMTPLPGSYLNIDPNLRIIAMARDPSYSIEEYRYKAVMVVRRATVSQIRDLRGKKACHTGYGRTTGWQIPVALLKRQGVIQPPCNPNQSTLEHEIVAVATAFNRACVPGEWATSKSVDASLKQRYEAMCSLCKSGTCDGNDDYAGYEGALQCLTQNGGDVAFSKLNIVQQFFQGNRAVNTSSYGLLCEDGRIVDIHSSNASDCFWAARPWDTYVTHGAASDAKVQRLFWALIQTKRKGEEDLSVNNWYFTTLGIQDSFIDILPVMDNVQTGNYYAKTRMDIVKSEEMCAAEDAVRFCVTTDDEHKKCDDLSKMLKLRGVTPDLQCVKGLDTSHCLNMISLNTADVVTLNYSQNYEVHQLHQHFGIAALLSESYASAESNSYYLVAVIKKGSGINTVRDLTGRTTCGTLNNSSDGLGSLINCLGATSDPFLTYADAFSCLVGSNKDVAFVKHAINSESDINGEMNTQLMDPQNFQLLCANGAFPVTSYNVKECNLGRIPANVVVTRESESGMRMENMRHLLLKAAEYFGKPDSFFRLFYNYFSKHNLLFRDDTRALIPVSEDTYTRFLFDMWAQACGLHERHLKSELPRESPEY
nr:transferrin-like isoform X2 [Procambarus clarkii]